MVTNYSNILILIINDTNETTKTNNQKIIKDLLKELIPNLKEKPILQNKMKL